MWLKIIYVMWGTKISKSLECLERPLLQVSSNEYYFKDVFILTKTTAFHEGDWNKHAELQE